MSWSNEAENALLEHVLNNVAWANIGDAGGLPVSVTNGNLYLSLHTADPGEAGDQTTSECTYTSYARLAIARNPSSKKWTVSGGAATNAELLQWVRATGGSETASYFGVGTAASGAGHLLISGALSPTLAISNGIQPEAAIGALSLSEN